MVRTRVRFPSTPLEESAVNICLRHFFILKGFKNAIFDCFESFCIKKIGEEIGEEKTQWHIVK